MQLGTENRNKTIAAVILGILALVLVAVRFFPIPRHRPRLRQWPPRRGRTGRWR